jgi:hypothetical protein
MILTLLYLTWVQCYYHVDRSITLRLITEFARTSTRSLTVDEIEAVCGLQTLIGTRLDALLHHGFLVRQEGRYYQTPLGISAARLGQLARRIIRLKPY